MKVSTYLIHKSPTSIEMSLKLNLYLYWFQNSFRYLVEREEIVHVSDEEYKAFIKPEATIQVYLKGTVKETKKSYAHNETLSLTKPSLKMEVRNFKRKMSIFTLKCIVCYVTLFKLEYISILW